MAPDGGAGFQFANAIGEAAHPRVQVFHFFLALIQPALQIKDARDTGEVDALARQLVVRLSRSISAWEYMRVLPLVRRGVTRPFCS